MHVMVKSETWTPGSSRRPVRPRTRAANESLRCPRRRRGNQRRFGMKAHVGEHADPGLVQDMVSELTVGNQAIAARVAALPMSVRGFGHVKLSNLESTRPRGGVAASLRADAICKAGAGGRCAECGPDPRHSDRDGRENLMDQAVSGNAPLQTALCGKRRCDARTPVHFPSSHVARPVAGSLRRQVSQAISGQCRRRTAGSNEGAQGRRTFGAIDLEYSAGGTRQ